MHDSTLLTSSKLRGQRHVKKQPQLTPARDHVHVLHAHGLGCNRACAEDADPVVTLAYAANPVQCWLSNVGCAGLEDGSEATSQPSQSQSQAEAGPSSLTNSGVT
jgi:hypothetical protein